MTNWANDKVRGECTRAVTGENCESETCPIGKQAIGLMRVPRDARVLDVGCGSGWTTRLLANLAVDGQVSGIDASDEMIRIAREASNEFSNIDFEVASAEKLPFTQNEFTHAFSMDSLYYYKNIQDAVGEIYRVLRPRGVFVAVVNLYQENEPTNYWVETLPIRVHQLSISDYHTLFRRVGFVHVRDGRIKSTAPLSNEYSHKWFASRDSYLEYRENGSLVMSGLVEK
ncbi:MAG TPA: class I SAM-dependent methyltransferase [Pyrinomonadaceae bacterium]|jgi:SAM-dependent methyltransferase|nr:class I SAM-dependent methyltransferase [Pyrinomonadaceae bacterium]